MLIYQQFFYLLIGLGILVGFPAFWLLAQAMWPATVERAREISSRNLVVNFLCGLPLVGLIILLLTQAGKVRAAGGSIAVTLTVVSILWALVGIAGLASHIGGRLWPSCTGDQAWRGQLRGGLVIAGALTIPFVGWFILPLVLVAIGMGIRVRMWFVRSAAPQPQLQPATATSTPPAMPQPQPTP
jgi:hypothetical protein